MGTLGFDKYSDPLKTYLAKYRDSVRGDRPEKKTPGRKEITGHNIKSSMNEGSQPMAFFENHVMSIPGEIQLPSLAPGKSSEVTIQQCHIYSPINL